MNLFDKESIFFRGRYFSTKLTKNPNLTKKNLFFFFFFFFGGGGLSKGMGWGGGISVRT